MKKSIIASVVVLGMIGGTAHAASEVIFSGAVSAKTCELAPSVNGGVPANQVVTLATAEPNQEGVATTFVMKPVNPTASGCTGLTDQNTISVGWSGSTLGAQGFKANPGSAASDAVVLLTAKNSKTANTPITASAPSVDFAGDKLTTDGLEFDAKTKGGAVAGNFTSTASFTVAYK
ncbi:fimbrial protein [Citrobacter freundii]|nr:fimbrial protein [Citrobacter freundii]